MAKKENIPPPPVPLLPPVAKKGFMPPYDDSDDSNDFKPLKKKPKVVGLSNFQSMFLQSSINIIVCSTLTFNHKGRDSTTFQYIAVLIFVLFEYCKCALCSFNVRSHDQF